MKKLCQFLLSFVAITLLTFGNTAIGQITIPVNATDINPGSIKNYSINPGTSIIITTNYLNVIYLAAVCPTYSDSNLAVLTNTQPYTLVTAGVPRFQADFEIKCVALDPGGYPTLICHVMVHINGTSVNDVVADNEIFSIYPNPTEDLINIKNELTGKFEIIDIAGKVIMTSEEKTIDVSKLEKGQYYLRMGNSTKPFIKK